MSMEIETHPVQTSRAGNGQLPKVVTMLAYEVYCHLYGEQEAMVTGWCRGGFGVLEIIAFLYARNFPKEQWAVRVQEAFKGAKNL